MSGPSSDAPRVTEKPRCVWVRVRVRCPCAAHDNNKHWGFQVTCELRQVYLCWPARPMVVQQKHACLSWQDHINTAKQRAIQPKLLTSNCTAGGRRPCRLRCTFCYHSNFGMHDPQRSIYLRRNIVFSSLWMTKLNKISTEPGRVRHMHIISTSVPNVYRLLVFTPTREKGKALDDHDWLTKNWFMLLFIYFFTPFLRRVEQLSWELK